MTELTSPPPQGNEQGIPVSPKERLLRTPEGPTRCAVWLEGFNRETSGLNWEQLRANSAYITSGMEQVVGFIRLISSAPQDKKAPELDESLDEFERFRETKPDFAYVKETLESSLRSGRTEYNHIYTGVPEAIFKQARQKATEFIFQAGIHFNPEILSNPNYSPDIYTRFYAMAIQISALNYLFEQNGGSILNKDSLVDDQARIFEDMEAVLKGVDPEQAQHSRRREGKGDVLDTWDPLEMPRVPSQGERAGFAIRIAVEVDGIVNRFAVEHNLPEEDRIALINISRVIVLSKEGLNLPFESSLTEATYRSVIDEQTQREISQDVQAALVEAPKQKLRNELSSVKATLDVKRSEHQVKADELRRALAEEELQLQGITNEEKVIAEIETSISALPKDAKPAWEQVKDVTDLVTRIKKL